MSSLALFRKSDKILLPTFLHQLSYTLNLVYLINRPNELHNRSVVAYVHY